MSLTTQESARALERESPAKEILPLRSQEAIGFFCFRMLVETLIGRGMLELPCEGRADLEDPVSQVLGK